MKKTEVLKAGAIPTREQLFAAIEDQEGAFKKEQLNNLLNQPPHKDWVKSNNGNEYLPIDKVEFMLTYIFQRWYWEIKHQGILANSVYTTGTLHVWNAWEEVWMKQDGTGAVPIQLDKSNPPNDIIRASDLSRLKTMSIQMNLPASSSYALSNAAGRFGKIFGRDLSRKDTVQFVGMYDGGQGEEHKQTVTPPIGNGMPVVDFQIKAPIPTEIETPLPSQKINIEL